MNVQSAVKPEDVDARAAASEMRRLSPEWRLSLAAWGALVAAIFLLLWRDVVDLVMLWWGNATYQHCLLVPPIIAYLVYLRRREVTALVPRPFLPAALVLFVGGIGWLLGEIAGVALVRHTALIGLLMFSVPLVFGLTVARGLLFPLFYAIFMIPFGDQLIPWLQIVTAKMSIELLDLFQVPAYIDGVFIEIPNGSFHVAEACSGARFLIAMIAFSTLVAHLCFKSTLRRITCVISAVVLAIVANGIRAWGTIYIAWHTDPSFAQGVDHVVYGWFFFALIMIIVLGVGWFFFDRPADDPAFDPARLQPSPPRLVTRKGFVAAAAAGIAAVIVAPAYTSLVVDHEPDVRIAAVLAPEVAGWTKVDAAGSGWQPHYDNATASAAQTYVDTAGRRVDLFVAVYELQTEDAEMITYGNGLIEPEGDWSWSRDLANPEGGRAIQIQRRPWTRDIWQYLLVGDAVTGSDYEAKLQTLMARLTSGPTLAGVLVLSTERTGGEQAGEAALRDFRAAMGDPQTVIRNAAIAE